jgi:hypothetical protein
MHSGPDWDLHLHTNRDTLSDAHEHAQSHGHGDANCDKDAGIKNSGARVDLPARSASQRETRMG